MSAVVVEIGANAAQFQKVVAGLPERVKAASSELKTAVAGIGFGLLAKQAVDVVGKFDRMSRAMTTLEGTAQAATARMDELREAGKLPGVDFAQAVQADIRLRSVGVSAEMSRAAIVEFGNALALAGGSAQDLDGVVLALTQIISKGKVSAEEINQIAERVPQVRRVMQQAFGTADTEALQKMKLTAEEFVGTLINGFGQLDRATAGLDEQFSDIRTTIEMATNALVKGFVGESVNGLSQLSSALGENMDLFEQTGSVISSIVTTTMDAVRALRDLTATGGAFVGLVAQGESPRNAAAIVSSAIDSQQEAAAAAKVTSPSRSKAAPSFMPPGDSWFTSMMGGISSAFTRTIPDLAKAMSEAMTTRVASLRESARSLGAAAFGPLKGDADISTGRGNNINPLTGSSSRQISLMLRQAAALENQAKSLVQSNTLLAAIEQGIRRFSPTYN